MHIPKQLSSPIVVVAVSSLLEVTAACGGTAPPSAQANAASAPAAMASSGDLHGTCDDACLPPKVKLEPLCIPDSSGYVDNWCQNLCVNTNFLSAGDTIRAGDKWTPVFTWITNAKGGALPNFPLKYPASYTAPGYLLNDPLLIFWTYLHALRITVDPGTNQERVHYYPKPHEVMRLLPYAELNPVLCKQTSDPFQQELCLFPAAWFVGVLHPLSVGIHTIVAEWSFSDPICDGVDVYVPFDCMPSGWNNALVPSWGSDHLTITVVPRP